MVEVANRSQQVYGRALSPGANYSRVVSCCASVPTGPGAVYSITPRVGNNVWLLKVRLWGAPKTANMANQTLFRVLTGTEAVASAAEILRWENLVPLVSPGFTDEPWTNYDGSPPFEWTMMRLFKGEGRMFGFWAERGPVGTDELFATFEISEG